MYGVDLLEEMADGVAKGDNEDCDTVCWLIGGLIRAAKIEAAARRVCESTDPAAITLLREELAKHTQQAGDADAFEMYESPPWGTPALQDDDE